MSFIDRETEINIRITQSKYDPHVVSMNVTGKEWNNSHEYTIMVCYWI